MFKLSLMTTISMLMNFLFCQMKHPMSLGLIMLLQTLLMSMIMGLISTTFWYSYIIFLIIVGALLILFIYMTSLVPNKKFKFSKNMVLSSLFISIFSFFYNITLNNEFMIMFNMKSSDMMKLNENYINKNNEMVNSLMYIYDMMMMNMTISLMSYLLYVLLIIMIIINMNLGTMRIMK